MLFTIINEFTSTLPFSVVVIVMLYDVNFLLVWKIDISLLTLMFLFVNVPIICTCSTFLKLGNKLPSLSKKLLKFVSSTSILKVSGVLFSTMFVLCV